MEKVHTAAAAAALIPDGATVLVDGSGGGVNEPDLILRAIERRFLDEGHPHDLALVHPSGMGDHQGSGMDRFAHEGLVRRVIGGHWGWCDRLQAMATNEQIEAYCLPQGVISHLLRAIAGKRPGVITHVGLGTFVDPRLDGGRLNRRARESLVELIQLAGQEWLFYPSFPIDVAIIRGSVADEAGNLTMEQEGLYAETLSAAQAAKNSGGIVLAQVHRLARRGSLDPRRVKVPGVLIDAVVVNPSQALSIEVANDPALWGELRAPAQSLPPLPLSERKVIARRAAQELRRGDVVNLGFGMPDGVASVLAEEGQAEAVVFTLEQGHFGGIPAGGANFGLARNQEAMVDAGYQFDWYDGGGLDIAVLSFAQIDAAGNVNVGKFGGRMPGVGGFINISQGARRIVFVGTLAAGRSQYAFTENGLRIVEDGAIAKFVPRVEQVSFSADYARGWNRPVVYVTERAVFELTEQGPMMTEIAPGLDLERDIIGRMGFRPAVSTNLQAMDRRLFCPERMGLSLNGAERRDR